MSEQARTLIQNATVLSMDPEVGDLAGGDVLVEGPLIRAVGRDLDVNGSVDVVDATGCIVVPGLVDTTGTCGRRSCEESPPSTRSAST